MSLKSTILASLPTSYWPLDDAVESARIHDECGLHDGVPTGVDLAEVPFGAARMPHMDGRQGKVITIPDDPRYSHQHANALTVACWVAPSALDFRYTDGSADQYVHFVQKAVDYTHDVEWAFRLYNHTNPERHSRMSFYLFNLGHPANKGAGAYMEHLKSINDATPVKARRWIFLVGQGEGWLDDTESTRGAILYKQGVKAVRSPGDKYNTTQWNIQPQHGLGPITIGGSIGKTAFCGAIGHLALWNRLLTDEEVATIYSAGLTELAESCH